MKEKTKILVKGNFYSCSEKSNGEICKVGFETIDMAKKWQKYLNKNNYTNLWFENEKGEKIEC